MKKHYWHAFRHEKLFEKQPVPHSQTPSYNSFELLRYNDCDWTKDMYDRKKYYKFILLHWRHNIHMKLKKKKQFIITL